MEPVYACASGEKVDPKDWPLVYGFGDFYATLYIIRSMGYTPRPGCMLVSYILTCEID